MAITSIRPCDLKIIQMDNSVCRLGEKGSPSNDESSDGKKPNIIMKSLFHLLSGRPFHL